MLKLGALTTFSQTPLLLVKAEAFFDVTIMEHPKHVAELGRVQRLLRVVKPVSRELKEFRAFRAL